VRIVDGAEVLACHQRSYDKGAQIEDTAHVQALVEQKRAARQHRATDRLVRPNAACVVSLVDRLVHNAEIIAVEGDSYRLKEARERADQRSRQRRGTRS
jgi:hypothetical protein